MCATRHAVMTAILIGAFALADAAFAIDWAKANTDARAYESPAVPRPQSASEQPTNAASLASNAYVITSFQQRTAAFAWQAYTTRIIFWMVISLVMIGVVFSAAQFWIALKRGDVAAPQELTISLQQVTVKSQFLGVVTLALALGFFYLYLVTVYPIVTVGDCENAAPGVTTASNSPRPRFKFELQHRRGGIIARAA